MPATNGSKSRNHQFKPNTHFDEVLAIYVFDRKLRLLVIEAIERIEVAVRAQWANALSLVANNPHAYLDANLFKTPWQHHKDLSKIVRDIEASHETFVVHYTNTYSEPFLPPIWAIVETLTLGALSRWYAGTKDNKVKATVSKALGMPTVEVMESVLHSLTLIRNVCAHHGRLWNRKMTMQLPNIKRLKQDIQTESIVDKAGNRQQQPRREIYNYLIVMVSIMKTMNSTTSWTEQLATLIKTITIEQQSAMGFPLEWQSKPIWQRA
jgi:abortive infection bacteriophage resistance protein